MSTTSPTVCAARRAQAARMHLSAGREIEIECCTCGAAIAEGCTPTREPAALHVDLEPISGLDHPEPLRRLVGDLTAQGVPAGTLRAVPEDEDLDARARATMLPELRADQIDFVPAAAPSAPISRVRTAGAPCSCPDLSPGDRPCALCLAREGAIEIDVSAEGPDLDAWERVIASISAVYPTLAIGLERVDLLAFSAARVDLGARGAGAAAWLSQDHLRDVIADALADHFGVTPDVRIVCLPVAAVCWRCGATEARRYACTDRHHRPVSTLSPAWCCAQHVPPAPPGCTWKPIEEKPSAPPASVPAGDRPAFVSDRAIASWAMGAVVALVVLILPGFAEAGVHGATLGQPSPVSTAIDTAFAALSWCSVAGVLWALRGSIRDRDLVSLVLGGAGLGVAALCCWATTWPGSFYAVIGVAAVGGGLALPDANEAPSGLTPPSLCSLGAKDRMKEILRALLQYVRAGNFPGLEPELSALEDKTHYARVLETRADLERLERCYDAAWFFVQHFDLGANAAEIREIRTILSIAHEALHDPDLDTATVKIRWGHELSEEPGTWSGAFTSREAAIEDGHATYKGEAFWVQKGLVLTADEVAPAVDLHQHRQMFGRWSTIQVLGREWTALRVEAGLPLVPWEERKRLEGDTEDPRGGFMADAVEAEAVEADDVDEVEGV